MVSRLELRRRWRAVVRLTVVSGAAAGFAVTASVGARRAWTAWDRLTTATLAPDSFYSVPPDADPALAARVAALPEVKAIGGFSYVPVAPAPLVPGQDAGGIIAVDSSFGTKLYRPLVVSGRHAKADRPDEVTINEKLAAKGVRVGQSVQLRAGFGDQAQVIASAQVVGIERGEFDLGANSTNAVVNLNHGFLEAHHDQLQVGPQSGAFVRLRHGIADRVQFQRSLREIYGPQSFVSPGDPLGDPVRQVLQVQRIAWSLLAAAAGLAVALAVGQAVIRVVRSGGDHASPLRALGMRRSQLVAVGMIQGLVTAVGVGAIAVVAGVIFSPAVPSGLARRADPSHGIRVEPLVLLTALLLIVLLLVSAGALGAWRLAEANSPKHRVRLPRLGRGPTTVSLGRRWALSSSPPSAAGSARSALAAVAIGLAGVTAVVTFAASIDGLHSRPRLFGWAFEGAFVAPGQDPADFPAKFPRLSTDPDVTGLAWGAIVNTPVDGEPIETYVLDQVKGNSIHPTLLDGRAPTSPDEVALGSGTLQHLHKHVGDVVTAAGKDGPQHLRIVGRAAYPEIGDNGDVEHMASMTPSALDRLQSAPVEAVAVIRVRHGANAKQVLARHEVPDEAETILAFEPRTVHNLNAVGIIPWVLAVFLALLAAAAIGHALAMSVRARRVEIAVLRALGLVRRQVRLLIAFQATTSVVIGAVIGIPSGILIGRWTWTAVAQGLGVLDRPVVEVAVIGLIGALALTVANVLASAPAVVAGRLKPADILRTE
jgi:hypothetical protein